MALLRDILNKIESLPPPERRHEASSTEQSDDENDGSSEFECDLQRDTDIPAQVDMISLRQMFDSIEKSNSSEENETLSEAQQPLSSGEDPVVTEASSPDPTCASVAASRDSSVFDERFHKMWKKATQPVQMSNKFPSKKVEKILEEDNLIGDWYEFETQHHKYKAKLSKYELHDDLMEYISDAHHIVEPRIVNQTVFLPYIDGYMVSMPDKIFKAYTNQLNKRLKGRTGVCFTLTKKYFYEEKTQFSDN